RSRGVGYGLHPALEAFEAANQRTHLFAQIETLAAVKNLDTICSVEGLSGILIGPGDLSASIGKTAQFDDPTLISNVTECIRGARAAGKHAGILVAPGPLLEAAKRAGADLIYCAGDINDLSRSWREVLKAVSE